MNARPPVAPGVGFITLTAWSLLVLGLLAGLLALLQGALAWFLDLSGITEQMLADPRIAVLPASIGWILSHLFGLSMAMLLLSLIAAAAGVGLLQRRDWGRKLSIGLMVVGAVAHLAGMVWQADLLAELRDRAASMPPPLDTLITAHYWSSQISGALFALVFAAGFAWTAWRLMQADIRAACAD